MAVLVFSPGYSAPLPGRNRAALSAVGARAGRHSARHLWSRRLVVPSSATGHVFRPDKFRLAFDILLKKGVVSRGDVAAPSKISKRDLLLVHTPAWTRKCLSGRFTAADSARAEMKITRAVIKSHLLHAGGTVKAVELALEGGLGINCGGGSHHARAEGGAGFCLVNDLALAARKAQKERGVKKVMIVDLDVHQGDGTAAVFKGVQPVFTFSMHQSDIYPAKKEVSSLDMDLPRGTGGAAYLRALRRSLPSALDRFKPGLVIYLAGADVCRGDLLGGLALSSEELRRRDAYVAGLCRERKIPLAVTLGGGYRKKAADTARLHAATIRVVLDLHKIKKPA
ncbi:MAG: histone deacetylase superfamily protein [Elusimicrobia bacterium]|nr:MAG: histone deacetylase superfamily protein [Elusimicrobiota bacterium]KAF0156729.1 MAG: histone deacetylase superfamily protein [Elusimicrobiota bacterium]